jgi:hypothetical protein
MASPLTPAMPGCRNAPRRRTGPGAVRLRRILREAQSLRLGVPAAALLMIQLQYYVAVCRVVGMMERVQSGLLGQTVSAFGITGL